MCIVLSCQIFYVFILINLPFQRYNDPVLRQTAEELSHAQNEIERLQDLLSERDHRIHDEIKESDQSQHTIGMFYLSSSFFVSVQLY